MHDCPECGQACYCDGEDTFFEDINFCNHCLGEDYREDAFSVELSVSESEGETPLQICECCDGTGLVPGEWYGEKEATTCPDCDGAGSEPDWTEISRKEKKCKS